MKTNYVLPQPPIPSSVNTASRVGGVAGCTGAMTNVQGARSDPGSQYMQVGGNTYYGFSKVDPNTAASLRGSYAPISVGKNNHCGGKKSRKRRSKRSRKTRHHKRRSAHHRRSKHHKKHSKHHRKSKRSRRRRTYKRRQRGGYSQYLSNIPLAHGYSYGGNISPANNALANPAPITAYNHCHNNYNHMTGKK